MRRVALVASTLPPGSRVHEAEMSDLAWGRSDYLTANLIDVMQMVAWIIANKDVKKSQRSALPDPVARPADHRAKESKALAMAREAKAFRAFQQRLRKGGVRWPSKSAKRTSL